MDSKNLEPYGFHRFHGFWKKFPYFPRKMFILRPYFCQGSTQLYCFKPSEFLECVEEQVIMRTNVTAPVKSEEFDTHPIWSTVYLFYWFALIKILRCSFSVMAISDRCHFHFCLMLRLSLHWSVALFFSLSPSPLNPHSVFTCVNSDKYSDDFVRWYHWKNFIVRTQLFHLEDCSQWMSI